MLPRSRAAQALPMLALAALTALSIAPALAAPLASEVHNGGFESWTDGQPDAWTVLFGKVQQTSNASAGSSAALLTLRPGGTLAAIAQAVPFATTDPPIVPGGSYELDLDAAQFDGSLLGAGGNASAVVRWFDAEGNVVAETDVPIAHSVPYAHIAATMQAPIVAGVPVTKARLLFKIAPPSPRFEELYVDAVAFGPVPPGGPPALPAAPPLPPLPPVPPLPPPLR